jgi:hypothetical protein
MIKFMLNTRKPNNYAFFCPVSRLHLTVSNPVGFASEVTPAISKALKAKTLLDVDGVVNVETGTVKAGKQAPKQEKPAEKTPAPTKSEDNGDSKQEATKVEAPVENAKAEEAKAEEESKKAKGGKKAAKAE